MIEFEERRKAVLKAWEKLREKYPKLPKLEEIEALFKFTANDPIHILSVVIGYILGSLSSFRGIVTYILEPVSLPEKFEAKFLSEEDKKKSINFIKRISYFYRKLHKFYFSKDEKEKIKVILECYKFVKDEVYDFLFEFDDKLVKGWEKSLKEEKSSKENSKMSYLG